MKSTSSGSSTFLYVILGFLFGLVIVAIGTVVALITAPMDFTLSNIIQAHLSMPLLWVIDSFPFFMAAVLGMLGSREDQLARTRREGRENQRRAAEVGRLNAELAKKDQERQDTEAVISRGKREWEATFDSVADIILIVDENGTLIRCNRAATYAFGTDFSQLIGKPVNELFFGSESTERLPSQKMEMKLPTLAGWHEVSSAPLAYEGVPQGKIYIVRNITDRKQTALDLERQKQFFESLVKNSPVGIVTLSLDHRVVACNPAFEVMFGYAQQEVLGQNIDSLISPNELIDESLLLTYSASQGEVVRKVTRRRHKNGILVDVELFVIPVVLWGKQIGVLGMYHNVSDLVSAGGASLPAVVRGTSIPAEEAAAQTPVIEQEVETLLVDEPPATPFAAPLTADELLETPVTALPISYDLSETPVTAPQSEEELPETPVAEDGQPGASLVEEKSTVVAPFVDFDAAEVETDQPAAQPPWRAINIEDIEGIGAVYAFQLGELGIHTTEDLLGAAATRKGRQELAEKSSISDRLILKWVNRADLMRVSGIGEEYSDLLEAAGVDTVRELRNRNPNNLYKALIEANAEKKLVRRLPHQSEVAAWVKAAKEIEPRVTY